MNPILQSGFTPNYDAHGKLRSTYQVDVEQIEMNSKIDPKEFDPDFPTGFDIQDLVNNKNYFVLENGTLFETEIFRDLSVTGEVEQKNLTNQWVLYVSVAIGVIVILIVCILIYRQKSVTR